MEVETGKDANNNPKEAALNNETDSLKEEQRVKLVKAKLPVNIANGFRLIFLFAAFIALIIVIVIEQLWGDTAWFDRAMKGVFDFLLWDILLMLLATFVKFFFVVRYNRVVKKL